MNAEPKNLREWQPPPSEPASGRLFTCGRPGRATFGTDWVRVPDDVTDEWASGLPSLPVVHIVSLLGSKPGGRSEFDYYPFRSSFEQDARPTFAEWLHDRYGGRFLVVEYPTTDRRGVPAPLMETIVQHVRSVLDQGAAVVIVDSAGAERTARVCDALGWVRP